MGERYYGPKIGWRKVDEGVKWAIYVINEDAGSGWTVFCDTEVDANNRAYKLRLQGFKTRVERHGPPLDDA